jgi:hypothetical protein
MGEMAVNGETESGSRTWLSALLGTMTGLIVSAGFGITTMVATGLNMGTRIALDGTVQAVFEPLAAYPVGVVAIAFAAFLYLARELWWASLVARSCAVLVGVLTTVAGSVLFSPTYLSEIGRHPWYLAIPVSASQTMALYAFVGIGVASVISSLAGRRRQSPPKLDRSANLPGVFSSDS